MQASWLTQFLSNDLHNRNTMYASWLTQFLFVTLNVSLTVLFVVVNRDFLEAKSGVNNKWTKLSPAATLLYLLWGFGQKQTKTIIKIICAPQLSSFWGINNQEIASAEWKDQWVLVKSGIFKWLARWRLLFGPLRSIYFISIKSLKAPS